MEYRPFVTADHAPSFVADCFQVKAIECCSSQQLPREVLIYLRTMKSADEKLDSAEGGSLWKGIALALACQFAYLFFVFELSSSEVRVLGYMLFALVQFAYLFPLAVFFQKRNQGLTSNGVMVAGAFALLVAAAWFGYAIIHGELPSIADS